MIRVGETELPWQEGMTVAQLLEEVADGYDYAIIRLNGRVVTRPYFNTTTIPDGSTILLLPMVAGG